MNLGAECPCPSAPSKPQPPQPTPRCSMGCRAQGCPSQGCRSGSDDIFLAIYTSGFKPSQHLQQESSCQKSH